MYNFYKNRQLFPESEIIVRKSLNQIDFEDSIKGENAFKIVTACKNGFTMAKNKIMTTPRAYQNRNYKPNTLNSCIQGCMIEQFPYTSGFCKGRRYYVKVNNNLLFCKQINKRFKPSNIQTRTVAMYDDQKSDNLNDTLPITYIGYQVSESYIELLGIYAVHMVGGDIEWISDIPSLACVEDSRATSTTMEPEGKKGISVVPKIQTETVLKKTE